MKKEIRFGLQVPLQAHLVKHWKLLEKVDWYPGLRQRQFELSNPKKNKKNPFQQFRNLMGINILMA